MNSHHDTLNMENNFQPIIYLTKEKGLLNYKDLLEK